MTFMQNLLVILGVCVAIGLLVLIVSLLMLVHRGFKMLNSATKNFELAKLFVLGGAKSIWDFIKKF